MDPKHSEPDPLHGEEGSGHALTFELSGPDESEP